MSEEGLFFPSQVGKFSEIFYVTSKNLGKELKSSPASFNKEVYLPEIYNIA